MVLRRIINGILLLIVLGVIGYGWWWSWRISLGYWCIVVIFCWWWGRLFTDQKRIP